MNGLRQPFDLPGVLIRISKKRAATVLLRKKRSGIAADLRHNPTSRGGISRLESFQKCFT
jgi:hypothetical protein